jgi:hypothetical protein
VLLSPLVGEEEEEIHRMIVLELEEAEEMVEEAMVEACSAITATVAATIKVIRKLHRLPSHQLSATAHCSKVFLVIIYN